MEQFRARAWSAFGTKQLKPLISKVFPLEQTADAHRMMEANANTGKILLQIRDE